MKILITGANGLLGSNLCLIYSNKHDVFATGINIPNFKFCKNYKLDVLDSKDLELITEINPDLIINCVALTNVDYCEYNELEAYNINAIGSKNVAEFSKKINSYLIHISTDSVFDGKRGNYSEEDLTNPINVYAKTKLSAETSIISVDGNYSIVRTSIYGWNRKNKFSLAEWMLDKLEKKEELPAMNDIYFSPILVNNLADALLDLYDLKFKGIINIVGSEVCSKLEFAHSLAEIFSLDKSLIKSVNCEELQLKAKRPKNVGLNIKKAKKILNTKLYDVKDGLKLFKDLKKSGYVDELRK